MVTAVVIVPRTSMVSVTLSWLSRSAVQLTTCPATVGEGVLVALAVLLGEITLATGLLIVASIFSGPVYGATVATRVKNKTFTSKTADRKAETI